MEGEGPAGKICGDEGFVYGAGGAIALQAGLVLLGNRLGRGCIEPIGVGHSDRGRWAWAVGILETV